MTALLTDLYELTMAASYLRREMLAPATFSLSIRSLPPDRGFMVVAGVESCLGQLSRFRFEPAELEHLEDLGFGDGDRDRFAQLRFTGDVWAMPEGTIAFAGEPILEVTAPLPEAQLVETLLLNQVTFETTIASKAARCVVAAQGRQLVDFAFRRTQGIEAGIAVARLTALVGFAATSNVEAARRYGLTATGTMAHSYVEAFPRESDAFRAFAEDFPGQVTLLVDTYDPDLGIAAAIDVLKGLPATSRLGIRLDSGDLEQLSGEARVQLDSAGLGHVRIIASGGLDEHQIEALVRAGAPVDAFGVGTRVGVSADHPYLDSNYKLAELDGQPVMKLSPGKHSLPGRKQVWRRRGYLEETIGLRDEPVPDGAVAILEQVMIRGRRTTDPASLAEARERFVHDLEELPEEARDLVQPNRPHVGLSPALDRLTIKTEGRAEPRSAIMS